MKALDLLKLWALGLGVPLAVFDDERVKWELAQETVDGVGIMQAIQRVTESNFCKEGWDEAYKVMQNPRYQLELIQLVS